MYRKTRDTCPSLTPTFILPQYQVLYSKYQGMFVTIGLLWSLEGVLTILSIISWHALLQRCVVWRRGKIQPTAIILCLTILALFASTTIYVVTCTLNDFATLMEDFVDMAPYIWFLDAPGDCWNYPSGTRILPQWADHIVWTQACGSAATLTVNVLLGDAIVCWRACVVWPKNHVVKAICGIFLAATFSLGVVDTNETCQYMILTPMLNGGGGQISHPGALFEGYTIGFATCALSLGTNILATVLVAYKAWQSRMSLKGYFAAKVGGSQVEKILTLLTESGAIYSAIWSVVVAFQVCQYESLQVGLWRMSTLETNFLDYFGLIMNGALVPVIGIYPAIIIVLVALNRSQIEGGLTQHLESLPTPHLAITANTVASISLHESHFHRRSQAPVADIQNSGYGDDVEDVRAGRTSEEWKAEGIANAA